MLRISKKSRRSTERVLDNAIKFFGRSGIGLGLAQQGDMRLIFEGGGGFVDVSVQPEGKETSVEIVTREWEDQVKRFLARV